MLGPPSGERWWTLTEATAHVAELTAPVIDAVRARLPVGPVAVWGGVADARHWSMRSSGTPRPCATCPLRTDDSRTRRLRSHLEASA